MRRKQTTCVAGENILQEGLNAHRKNDISFVFQKLAHEQGKCVVVVTHSRELAEQVDVVLRLPKRKIADDINIGES